MFNKYNNNETIKDIKGTIIKLLNRMKKYKITLIIIIIFAIGSSIFSILGPKILGNATTLLFEGYMEKLTNNGSINFEAILNIIFLLLGLYMASMILSFVQGFLMSGISQKVTYQMRKDISIKINNIPLNYFDTNNHGETQSTIVNDVDTLSVGLNQSMTQLITSITSLVGILIMMLSINVTITIVALIILPLSMYIVSRVIKKSQIHFKNQQNHLANINGKVEEIYPNHLIVKTFNAQNKLLKDFDKSNDELYESGWKSQFISGILQPTINFIGNISYVIVAIIGAIFAGKGIISVGEIQSLIQYSKNFSQPIGQLAQVSNMIQSMLAASERIFTFLETEEEQKDIINPKKIKRIKGNIEFKNVNFRYNEEQQVIKKFSAKIKSGQKIAIVGPTGAGKTTIVKLLMRYYDIENGSILIDGINIKEMKKRDLRNMFKMVLQDTWLFNASIMDNLRYGNLSYSDEEITNVVKSMGLDNFIKTLPSGYETIINEESSNISSGQKQLITIIRAMVANPEILILDEATSNIDTKTEKMIQQSMDHLTKGRTSFIIAHRLSTVRNADKIFVLDNGNIIEQGTHKELLTKKGFYNELYSSQFDI